MQRELIEIGSTIRVENGPVRRTAEATEELLDNTRTATHYQVEEKDALGKSIVLGEDMTYLDYKGEWVWYVYHLEDDETAPDGKRWMTVSVEDTKEDAMAAAEALEE